MSKGYSLHLGLNETDSVHYNDLSPLKAAIKDALFWESFASRAGYNTRKLHDAEATAAAVKDALAEIAQRMEPGDILLLTYAGHGGQLQNQKQAGLDREPYDQTWCLFDRQMLDDELYDCFTSFRKGTRIVVVSDSCHSGTITKFLDSPDFSSLLEQGSRELAVAKNTKDRSLPASLINNEIRESVYRPIQEKYRYRRKGSGVTASVTLLAACQDHQVTYDGEENGIFTGALRKLLDNEANIVLNAESLVREVSRYYTHPIPNLFQYGAIIPTSYEHSPFSIDIPQADHVTGYKDPHLSPPQGQTSFPFSPAGWDDTTVKARSALLRVEISVDQPSQIKSGEGIKILRYEQEGNRHMWELELLQIPQDQAWTAAHTLQSTLSETYKDVEVIPLLSMNLAPSVHVNSREGDRNNPDYISEWPPAQDTPKVPIGWHLDEYHSQLAKAREFVEAGADSHLNVRIAHLDTGYYPDHPAEPVNINKSLACSFIPGEEDNQAVDHKDDEGQEGHGTGTLMLLAGKAMDSKLVFGEMNGHIGGAPFADVIPMRISNSVVIWNSDNFCRAIQRAIDLNCEVVSMSMAGKPSPRMAEMVDKAYEAGIVIVSAASNCWYKGTGALLPKCVLYPAAFQRVIGATGALYNHNPYDRDYLIPPRFNISTKYMQGSWGPPSRMSKALAAYTPNVPWASHPVPILRSGGGTSSATPQIAAAAALWIGYYRKQLEELGYYQPGKQWMKVEAVRQALYMAAAKEEVFTEWDKFFGNGILRAYNALQVPPRKPLELEKAPEARVILGGFIEITKSFLLNLVPSRSKGPQPSKEAISLEILHLLQTDPSFFTQFENLDINDRNAVTGLLGSDDFKSKILKSDFASIYLKEFFI
jgi:subtilisin family serine protease